MNNGVPASCFSIQDRESECVSYDGIEIAILESHSYPKRDRPRYWSDSEPERAERQSQRRSQRRMLALL